MAHLVLLAIQPDNTHADWNLHKLIMQSKTAKFKNVAHAVQAASDCATKFNFKGTKSDFEKWVHSHITAITPTEKGTTFKLPQDVIDNPQSYELVWVWVEKSLYQIQATYAETVFREATVFVEAENAQAAADMVMEVMANPAKHDGDIWESIQYADPSEYAVNPDDLKVKVL